MRCGIRRDKLDMTIGVDYMPNRKKPCLVIKEGNTETKYASFNDAYSAQEFMRKLAEMLNLSWEDSDVTQ